MAINLHRYEHGPFPSAIILVLDLFATDASITQRRACRQRLGGHSQGCSDPKLREDKVQVSN